MNAYHEAQDYGAVAMIEGALTAGDTDSAAQLIADNYDELSAYPDLLVFLNNAIMEIRLRNDVIRMENARKTHDQILEDAKRFFGIK